jgi:hypothetical protein
MNTDLSAFEELTADFSLFAFLQHISFNDPN